MGYEAGSSTTTYTLLIRHQSHMDRTSRTTGPQGGGGESPAEHMYHRVKLSVSCQCGHMSNHQCMMSYALPAPLCLSVEKKGDHTRGGAGGRGVLVEGGGEFATLDHIWGFPPNYSYLFRGPHDKDYIMFVSILPFPYFGKLPYMKISFKKCGFHQMAPPVVKRVKAGGPLTKRLISASTPKGPKP